MKALTVRQPWAWAILHAGKNIENRDWPTGVRGTVAVHAAKGMTGGEFRSANMYIRRVSGVWCPAPQTLTRGAVVGLVDIVDCVDDSPSRWFEGWYGFELANPRPLATPVPCVGALGFWNLPPEVEARVLAQTEKAA